MRWSGSGRSLNCAMRWAPVGGVRRLSKWTTDVHLERYTTLVHRLLDQKRGKV